MEFYIALKLFLLLVLIIVTAKSTDPDVPKQLKRIYKRFKHGKLPRRGINAVRCIQAHEGKRPEILTDFTSEKLG